jgi:GT2 family glycosyltransferase
MSIPYISIVIGSNNRLELLKLTIDSVRNELSSSSFDYEIIVVDGGSIDGSLEWLTHQIDLLTIAHHNSAKVASSLNRPRRSWGYFMNLGFKCAQGKYVCMLSDDCILVPNSIKNGIEVLDRKIDAGQKIGAGAFYWRNWPDEQAYHVKLTLGNFKQVNHGLFLREALLKVGYADERNYFFYHADADLVLSIAKLGYEIIDIPGSYVEHFSHAGEMIRASNSINEDKDWLVFLSKWNGKHDYPDSQEIRLSYEDPSKTADLFRRTKSYKTYSLLLPLYEIIKKNKAVTSFLVKSRKLIAKSLKL